MLIPGLVSVTFRHLAPPEIVSLVQRASLKSIEWGGDIHVPPGNQSRAREVRKQTEEAGLSVAAYGSYYRVGLGQQEDFAAVLETAIELGAPTIRVWAGNSGSRETPPDTRHRIVEETRSLAERAKRAGVSLSFEFHGHTLTDTHESAAQLLQEVNHDNVHTLWQPPVGSSASKACLGLTALLPWLTNVHLFTWRGTERLPLSEGSNRWMKFLQILHRSPRDHHLLMEFIRNDSPEQFFKDAATLQHWLKESTPAGKIT